MMKYVFLLVVFAIGSNFGCSQYKSAPKYLLNQKFPDSVAQFKMQNSKGALVTFEEVLEAHKGKKVVLDFWASWCKDCLEGLPELKKLQKETKNVDYVFLSLDRTTDRWKKAVESLAMEGDHYFITEGWENPLTNYINLDWIPRYMILDEEGRVINAKTIKATDRKFRKQLLE